MLTLSREVMLEELRTAQSYLQKWTSQLEAGIPGVHVPATESSEAYVEHLIREMCGELRVVAGKCETLAEVFQDSLMNLEG